MRLPTVVPPSNASNPTSTTKKQAHRRVRNKAHAVEKQRRACKRPRREEDGNEGNVDGHTNVRVLPPTKRERQMTWVKTRATRVRASETGSSPRHDASVGRKGRNKKDVPMTRAKNAVQAARVATNRTTHARLESKIRERCARARDANVRRARVCMRACAVDDRKIVHFQSSDHRRSAPSDDDRRYDAMHRAPRTWTGSCRDAISMDQNDASPHGSHRRSLKPIGQTPPGMEATDARTRTPSIPPENEARTRNHVRFDRHETIGPCNRPSIGTEGRTSPREACKVPTVHPSSPFGVLVRPTRHVAHWKRHVLAFRLRDRRLFPLLVAIVPSIRHDARISSAGASSHGRKTYRSSFASHIDGVGLACFAHVRSVGTTRVRIA